MTTDVRELLEKLDSRQQQVASQVIAIERKHNFKARNRYVDEDIVKEIVQVVEKVTQDLQEGDA